MDGLQQRFFFSLRPERAPRALAARSLKGGGGALARSLHGREGRARSMGRTEKKMVATIFSRKIHKMTISAAILKKSHEDVVVETCETAHSDRGRGPARSSNYLLDCRAPPSFVLPSQK